MNKQTEALKMARQFIYDVTHDEGCITGLNSGAYQWMLDKIDEALEQPAQEPVAWISVDDKLPEFVTVNNYEKSSDDILILIDGKHVYVGSWIYDNWSKTNDFCMRDLDGGYEVVDGMKVTHWMPLPSTPKEQL